MKIHKLYIQYSFQIQVLKEQLFRLMRLKQNPLRIEGDIAQVTSNEGITGIQELIQNIEIMAVNRELFPNGQREIPRQWEAFRMALKREKAYCLQLNQLQVSSFNQLCETTDSIV